MLCGLGTGSFSVRRAMRRITSQRSSAAGPGGDRRCEVCRRNQRETPDQLSGCQGPIDLDVQTGPWLDCKHARLSISCQSCNYCISSDIGQIWYRIGKGVNVHSDRAAAANARQRLIRSLSP